MINSAKIIDQNEFPFSQKEILTIILLVLLSYTGISIITIGKALLTPFHLLMALIIIYAVVVSKKSQKQISFSLILFLGYVLALNVYQNENVRVTSVLYTLIYGIEATILFNLLSKCKKSAILLAFEIIIYSYFLNLLLGFCLDLIQVKSGFLQNFIKIYYSKNEVYGRPMGFSSEPSYAAFILTVVYLCYSSLTNYSLNKNALLKFVIVVFAIILSKSAYGFLFIGVATLDWFFVFYKRGDRLFRLTFPFLGIILLLAFIFLLQHSENKSIDRIAKFGHALFDTSTRGQNKLNKLQKADGSAFARIAPTYLLFVDNEEHQFNFLFGEGAGSAGKYLSKSLTGILVDEGRESVDTGIMPALIFDYGYFGSILFILFLYFTFRNLSFSFWLLFLLIIPNANINTQLIWFAIICFSCVSLRTKFSYPKNSC